MDPKPTPKTVIAFDLYGTLLSTSSISTTLCHLLSISPEKAIEVAELWRRYQLEYTWRLNSMNLYKPFSLVTLSSFRHALLESDITTPITESLEQAILEAYDSLDTFPDAVAGLASLAERAHLFEAYIFSNGTASMIANSTSRSPSLCAHAAVFQELVSVEPVGRFKPAPEVYHHLARCAGRDPSREALGAVWVVSSNPFDVAGAKNVGMRAAWVDRKGKGWCDELLGVGEGNRPDLIVTGVDDAVNGIEGWGGL